MIDEDIKRKHSKSRREIYGPMDGPTYLRTYPLINMHLKSKEEKEEQQNQNEEGNQKGDGELV